MIVTVAPGASHSSAAGKPIVANDDAEPIADSNARTAVLPSAVQRAWTSRAGMNPMSPASRCAAARAGSTHGVKAGGTDASGGSGDQGDLSGEVCRLNVHRGICSGLFLR